MARMSVLGERADSTGPAEVEPRCPRGADACSGTMRGTGKTTTVPAWGYDTLALLRCPLCGEHAWYRQRLAFEPLPADLEVQ
jgi:hypothetical protein